MVKNSNFVYNYDGSFEGLLCCVFESYEKNEVPADISTTGALQTTLLPVKEIITDTQRASRVLVSIPKKIGTSALEFIQLAYLSCLPQKELYILLFLRLGYQKGPIVMTMLSNDIVNVLFKAVKNINNESHLLKGFIRFSVVNDALVSTIEPKNYVLPLLRQHFCERYPEEQFLIYDKAHSMALIYEPHNAAIIPMEDLKLPQFDKNEVQFQNLWKLYYNTIEIQGRHNPTCRMSHMPKRYWTYMTEFQSTQDFLPGNFNLNENN